MRTIELAQATASLAEYAQDGGKEPLVVLTEGKPVAVMQAVRTVEMAQATESLGKYARGVSHEPLILTRNGRPFAILMSLPNTDLETVSLSTNPEFIAMLEQSEANYQAEGGISSEEMRRRLGVKPAKPKWKR
jgi:PHD/YefM family antitoxin component YafN of YafNO toxin-antitoxin module